MFHLHYFFCCDCLVGLSDKMCVAIVAHYDYTSCLKSLFLLMYFDCRAMMRRATSHQDNRAKARMLKEPKEKKMDIAKRVQQ